MRRLSPLLLLVVSAAVVEARGLETLTFYLLVLAVPVAALSSLAWFGDLIDAPREQVGTHAQAALSLLALFALLVATAARGQHESVPAVGSSSLLLCLAALALQALAYSGSSLTAKKTASENVG